VDLRPRETKKNQGGEEGGRFRKIEEEESHITSTIRSTGNNQGGFYKKHSKKRGQGGRTMGRKERVKGLKRRGREGRI